MKVERVIGWLKGISGIGNVFEISHAQGYALAMIWSDGKFHYLDVSGLNEQIQLGTAAVAPSALRLQYVKPAENNDGSLTVENPDGWKRLYEPITPGDSQGETVETKEIIEIPFKFEGKLSIDVSQFAALLKLVE